MIKELEIEKINNNLDEIESDIKNMEILGIKNNDKIHYQILIDLRNKNTRKLAMLQK